MTRLIQHVSKIRKMVVRRLKGAFQDPQPLPSPDEAVVCPNCLCPSDRKHLKALCASDCGLGSKLQTFLRHQPFYRLDPWGQSLPCDQKHCRKILTRVTIADCDKPLSHPAGLPRNRLKHVLVLALDGRDSTMLATQAALAVAMSNQELQPATSATWSMWRDARMADRFVVPSPERTPGLREPIVFGRFPSKADEVGLRVYLHGWPMTELIEENGNPTPGACAQAIEVPAAQRALAADWIVIACSSRDLFSRAARDRLQTTAAALGRRLDAVAGRVPRQPLPGLVTMIGDAESLYQRLGSVAMRPAQLPDTEHAGVTERYVRHALRLDEVLAPLQAIEWPKKRHLLWSASASGSDDLSPWILEVLRS